MTGKKNQINRRTLLKTSPLLFLGLSFPGIGLSQTKSIKIGELTTTGKIPEHFPNIDPEIVSSVVGKSHSDLEAVKELVDKRPELARSVWEWRFGDFESAIGAASHVGRRDIALYLISKGARPTLFTFAMLGAYDVIKSAVEASPGIQKTMGPHGISLLAHAYAGERMKEEMTESEVDRLKLTIDYLESLGDADGESYIDMSSSEQEMFLGDYQYGTGETEGFTISVNMRQLLSIGPIGGFGGGLYKIGENKYTYNGTPSVIISFNIENDVVKSLKLEDPDITIVAEKV